MFSYLTYVALSTEIYSYAVLFVAIVSCVGTKCNFKNSFERVETPFEMSPSGKFVSLLTIGVQRALYGGFMFFLPIYILDDKKEY